MRPEAFRRVALVAAVAFAAVAGCGVSEQRDADPRASYDVLDPAAQPLRDTFNADAGSVRVLVLASPT